MAAMWSHPAWQFILFAAGAVVTGLGLYLPSLDLPRLGAWLIGIGSVGMALGALSIAWTHWRRRKSVGSQVVPPNSAAQTGSSAALRIGDGLAQGNLLIARHTTIDLQKGAATNNVQMEGFGSVPIPPPTGELKHASNAVLRGEAEALINELGQFEEVFDEFPRPLEVEADIATYLRRATGLCSEMLDRQTNYLELPEMSQTWFGARIISQQHFGGAFAVRCLCAFIRALADRLPV